MMKKSRHFNAGFIIMTLIITVIMPLLTSCAAFDKAFQTFSNTEQMAHDFVEGQEVSVSDALKYDSYSAGDAVGSGADNGTYEQQYYDEKSGTYVSGAQYKANSVADSLKAVWIPIVAVSFVFGFLLRRFVHGSATIRKLGLVFEIAVPVLLTVVVYAVCGAADSSVVHFFDFLF